MSVQGSLKSTIQLTLSFSFLLSLSPINCTECGGEVVITFWIFSFTIISIAFLYAYFFQPIRGSGTNRLLLIPLTNFCFQCCSSTLEYPAVGTLDFPTNLLYILIGSKESVKYTLILG